ncbi:hypothetical protein AEAC466_07130 [Asticcacaulis sp. AC466]|uniref:hypothetical protein n=1 Tax=Asticcacaulis sp. AC466 TaxID=1282362 RepID=UPI0003C3D6A0|nr:hypothetical protein [Asticcacaulis sp. AC466]ESQ84823.1 hypothetical protein AEAC466_07130 [Asticcacaulis sp. AC466]
MGDAPILSAGLLRAASDSDFSTTREIRNLANLNRTWSSCRVLNLAKLYTAYNENEDYIAKPMFEHSALNRAVILKHTLRLDERDLFPNGRRTVTKIILPYDPYDLKLGGRSFFYRQTQFETLMRSYLGIEDLGKNRDARILRCIDELPSLDPFLLREHLDKAGFNPSGVYFQISAADLKAMTAFTAREIENLVNIAFGGTKGGGATKLGNKILSDKLNQTLAPLQETLHMSDEEFQEGIMCWRGFLYYKWCHVELQDGLREVLAGIGSHRISGTYDDHLRTYLRKARPRIARAIIGMINDAKETLTHYDDVYTALATRGDPEPFRQFLLFGSELFVELGQKIGTLNHIASFWRFRMARLNKKGVKPLQDIEFADILMDFEAGLFNVMKRDIMRQRA